MLASLDQDKESKTEPETETEIQQLLEELASQLDAENCVADRVTSDKTSLEITGLQPETDYIFYVRNISETAADEIVFSGAVSAKSTTKSIIFDSIEMVVEVSEEDADGDAEEGAVNPIVKVIENDTTVYIIEEAQRDVQLTVSYNFIKDEDIMAEAPEFKSSKFNSSNTNIAKLTAVKGDATKATLSYGAQVGDAEVYVTGKDSSGTTRTSEKIIIRTIRKPTKLAKKTTTLAIGQSVSIKDLIGTDLKGNMSGMDLSAIHFDEALTNIIDSGYFEISYSSTSESAERKAEDAIITAAKLINGKSGSSVGITFSMDKEENGNITETATIKINDIAAPTISKVTVRDTSAIIQFKPSTAVTEKSDAKYYTLKLTDTVTKEEWEVTESIDGTPGAGGFTCKFTPDSVNPGTVWTCEIGELSSSKAYNVALVAHYEANITGADGSDESVIKNDSKPSASKKFTTTKPLLTFAGGSIDLKYINLEELRRLDPNSEEGMWHEIKFGDNNADDIGSGVAENSEKVIELENNGTYVFMAQISNLARVLETDKLKWAVASGDKKAGTIKATSSSFEMQLTTTKVGTFTVTATSTLSKEVLASFVVNVTQYQSGNNTSSTNNTQPFAYLPEIETGLLRKEEWEDAA